MPPGNYAIIPCLFNGKLNSEVTEKINFFLKVFSNGPVNWYLKSDEIKEFSNDLDSDGEDECGESAMGQGTILPGAFQAGDPPNYHSLRDVPFILDPDESDYAKDDGSVQLQNIFRQLDDLSTKILHLENVVKIKK